MATFFPRQTIEFKIEEPKAFRRLSFSLVGMAILTGVLVRMYRLAILNPHAPTNWIFVVTTFFFGIVLLVGLATAHLSNYPLHQYVWRAPAFVLVEVVAEMAVSAVLTSVHIERNGTAYAHWDDWAGMAFNALWIRALIILLWTLILAGIVQIVRRTIVQVDPELPEARPGVERV